MSALPPLGYQKAEGVAKIILDSLKAQGDMQPVNRTYLLSISLQQKSIQTGNRGSLQTKDNQYRS